MRYRFLFWLCFWGVLSSGCKKEKRSSPTSSDQITELGYTGVCRRLKSRVECYWSNKGDSQFSCQESKPILNSGEEGLFVVMPSFQEEKFRKVLPVFPEYLYYNGETNKAQVFWITKQSQGLPHVYKHCSEGRVKISYAKSQGEIEIRAKSPLFPLNIDVESKFRLINCPESTQ